MDRYALCALVCTSALVACRSPTQISVTVQTDVPCAQVTVTAFTSGELVAIESIPPTTESTQCSGGHLGTVVLVPSGGDDAEVGFKVVTALNGETIETCNSAAAASDVNCIVSRRALRYLPHTRLDVIVDMTQACEGDICDPESTCVDRVCKSATIPNPAACEGAGCNASVLGPEADDAGIIDATVNDAPVDSTVSSPDSGDAGHDAGTEDAGPVCAPGDQRCSGNAVQICLASGQWGVTVACDAQNPVCSNGACLAPSLDGGTVTPASCLPGGAGMSNCGPGGSGIESCCTSLEVGAGTFYRTYGGTPADPATVSGFRLDEYLVTLGRFRQFVNAWDGGAGLEEGGAGYEPPAGSGKHTHLNGGNGLRAVGDDAGVGEDAGPEYETGWVASDDIYIAPTSANLATGAFSTWTSSPGGQENLPINSITWQEAYAFCIWDGAFLPSAAEWEYAAAGGSQQRLYPWGSTDPSTAPNQYAIYGGGNPASGCYYPSGTLQTCTGVSNIAPVGTAALGAGLWGGLDLAGEVFEWNLDWNWFYVDPCVDCAYLNSNTGYRALHGAGFDGTEQYLEPETPYYGTPLGRGYFIGFRCARVP